LRGRLYPQPAALADETPSGVGRVDSRQRYPTRLRRHHSAGRQLLHRSRRAPHARQTSRALRGLGPPRHRAARRIPIEPPWRWP